MLSIDEAIAFERQQAKDRRNEHYTFGIQKSKEAAEEHEQLAEWLEELKQLREQTTWIPCSERLPKYGEVVMCSCTNSGITISCITHKVVKPSKSVRFGQHSVNAWMPLPQPYKVEGSDGE